MNLQDYSAVFGIAIAASGVIGWLFKVGHDRNIDAHDGIVGRVAKNEDAARNKQEALQRIETALGEMAKKLDRFEQQYWQHRAGRSEGE